MINIIKRFYIMVIVLSMVCSALVLTQEADSQFMTGLIRTFITIPFVGYGFYRIVRFISYGK